jgi:HK97 family phage portal protein
LGQYVGLWKSSERDLLAEDQARSIRAVGSAVLEKRSIVSSIADPTKRFLDALGLPSSSGAIVNEATASTIPILAACVGVLSDMVAMLPLGVYRKTNDGREEVIKHPAHKLIAVAPNDLHTPYELRQQAMAGVGYGGNGYLRVWRDSYYQPGEIQWVPPIDVRPELYRRTDGRYMAQYIIRNEREPLTRADLVHVRGISANGLIGMSPIRALRESIGLSLTQREQSGRIYANGARFPGYLVAPQSLNKTQIDDARKEWREGQAGTENAGKNPILWGGWDYKATQGMSLKDAEFLESRKFERTEIATLYRIPEVLFGNSDKSSSWGTGIETLTNGFLAFSLGPWLVNWEQALNFTLLTTDELLAGYYFRFTRTALLQVAMEAQAKFFREMRDIGVYSVDDIRRKLEENDLKDNAIGRDYRLPFNSAGGAGKAVPDASQKKTPEPVPAK